MDGEENAGAVLIQDTQPSWQEQGQKQICSSGIPGQTWEIVRPRDAKLFIICEVSGSRVSVSDFSFWLLRLRDRVERLVTTSLFWLTAGHQ
jgi:hypothetical protein